ncbi:MAG: hypothetical protein JWN34_2409 [Bryobacterales bacterium]|jgi:hypothetical protein|nr:hypothetical protein [Bryobacterales bacterium]
MSETQQPVVDDVRKSSDLGNLGTMHTSDGSSQPDALYLSWRLRSADITSVDQVKRRLALGETKHLYRLRSWVIVGGEVQALLSPAATLDRIATAIWGTNSQPIATRWVQSKDCAKTARDIETSPVSLGLAASPEQWPFSSAARH